VDAKVDKTLKITTPSDLEIAMTREFDAPRHLVFDAMTKPEYVRRWFGCEAFTLPVCGDRSAGRRRLSLHHAERRTGSTARFRHLSRIVRPERIVFTERFSMRDSPATNTRSPRLLWRPAARRR